MGAERSNDLERVAQAVADGTPIDWKGEMAARPDLSEALERLSQLERVREAHGGVAATAELAVTKTQTASAGSPPPPERPSEEKPLFVWGTLRVLELVGEGTGGEVYRAYDPKLQTIVALKLRRRDEGRTQGAVDDFLSEGRRLARIRHPNVLVVHGAAEHDGRTGIWTEFIHGKSLEDYLQQAGPLSAREATLIGLDLCRALAAVHAAKWVHCDVKTRNVMREEGGRIILADFGSMGDARHSEAGLTTGPGAGTPLAMSPEQLRGEGPRPAADLYGLGVLLYRMVTGHYPIETDSLSELTAKHRRGERVPLRDRRADLPLDFVEVVERALRPESQGRFASAGQMERALGSLLGPGYKAGQEEPQRNSPVWIFAAAAGLLVVGIAVFLWLNGLLLERSRRAATPPTVTALPPAQPALTATATLLRRSGSKVEPLPAVGGRIRPGDHLAMELRGDQPMHVYVLNEDTEGKVFLLFPIPGVSPTNPLAAGVPHRLPGQVGDSLVYWVVTSAGGRDAVAAIASREPLEALERVMTEIPHAAPGRPVEYAEVRPDQLENLRGIGGLKKEGEVPVDARRRLEAAIESLAERAKKLGDVWVWTTNLENPPPSPDRR